MSREEREAFLAGVHVGMIGIPDPGHGPLVVPIWYGYEPGGPFWVVTERASRKGRLLAVDVRVSLCAQTEAPPYRYVSVEGPVVSLEAADVERDVRPMARRYLGYELGDRYVEVTSGERGTEGSVVVRVRPERWLSVDYGKAYAV
jgi:nitroimidazol reductase NimA-like FMN-containing flavoprotein (pyridoxamine 5'-phosphate oxidase superfamily)